MVQISRFKLSNQKLDKLFTIFFEVVGKKREKSQFLEAIENILSPVERIMVAKRIAIMYLLLRDIPQRNIARVLHVSVATVAKFSGQMNQSPRVRNLYKKMLMEDKIVDFIDALFDTFFAPGTYGANWGAGWERKRRMSRRKEYGLEEK